MAGSSLPTCPIRLARKAAEAGVDGLACVASGAGSHPDSARKRWKEIWAAGQGLQAIHSVEPVSTLVDEFERDYRADLDRLARLSSGR
jgi:hypothetical protein